jgi:hypothetical protein
MPALDKNIRKPLGANAVTRPVDELMDTALIHFAWNFGKAQDGGEGSAIFLSELFVLIGMHNLASR